MPGLNIQWTLLTTEQISNSKNGTKTELHNSVSATEGDLFDSQNIHAALLLCVLLLMEFSLPGVQAW